jgi:hypothetical protein
MIGAALALIMTSRMYQRLDVFHGAAVQNAASGIRIDAIYALNTVQYYDNAVFSNSYMPSAFEPPYECAAFTNLSQQVATAVEIRFSYVDTVGDLVGRDELTIAGKFSPGIAIDGTKKECRPFKGYIDEALDLYYAGQHAMMNGTVIYVRFADGSTWRYGSPS